jgi:glutathione S-transferase
MTRLPLTFYHAPHSRSFTVLWLLEELGVPYDMKLINFKKGEQRQAEHLGVNPMGKVPAIRYGDAVVTESAAVCTYLADIFSEKGLAPDIDDPMRGPYLRWMIFAAASMEPAILDRALKREPGPPMQVGYGDFDTVVEVAAKAVAKGPYILGDRFSAADVYVGSGMRWTLMFKLLPERPEFVEYVGRLNERPALKRATARDAELAAKQNG